MGDDPAFCAVRGDLQALIAQELRPSGRGDRPERRLSPRLYAAYGGGRRLRASCSRTSLGACTGRGLTQTIQLMEDVARECLSTGFCVWCQIVCAWYIQNGESDVPEARDSAACRVRSDAGGNRPLESDETLRRYRKNSHQRQTVRRMASFSAARCRGYRTWLIRPIASLRSPRSRTRTAT